MKIKCSFSFKFEFVYLQLASILDRNSVEVKTDEPYNNYQYSKPWYPCQDPWQVPS